MGLTPDPWQKQVMLSPARQLLLNCSRQSGKSTITAALALHEAMFKPNVLVLLVAPGLRQSGELFRKTMDVYNALKRPLKYIERTQLTVHFANGSRIVALPGAEETVRGYSAPSLVVFDEAARVPDDLYHSIRPMLAVSKGRLIAMSSPFGKRGWYYREAKSASTEFEKFTVPWTECPRIDAGFIAEERRVMGQPWISQEYECVFTTMEGLVYPEFKDAVIDFYQPPSGRLLGGIDWGWRNPFAAVWGFHDKASDTLYIQGERYLRETLLSEHVRALRALGPVTWYGDPAGADQLNEGRAGGLSIVKGNNDIALGIAAVTARIRTGRLKVLGTKCFNLIAEAELYRYPDEKERIVHGEKPLDDNNHALGALRYLVSRLDHHFISKLRRRPPADAGAPYPMPKDLEARYRQGEYKRETIKPWNRIDNPALWPERN